MSSNETRFSIRLVQAGQREDDAENWISLDVSDAAKYVLSGSHVLAADFARPPTELTRHLAREFSQTHLIGPSALGGNAFEHISDTVLRNGVRQQLVHGREVSWARDRWETLSLVASKVWRSASPQIDLLDQLVRVHDRHTAKFGDFKMFPRTGTASELRKRNLVDYLKSRSIGTTQGVEYAQVDPDWTIFYVELKELLGRIESATSTALQDARIIMVEETDLGARVVAPSAASFQRRHKSKTRQFYCATADLPVDWFKSAPMRNRDRKRATQFAEFAFRHDWGGQRRPSAGDVRHVMCERLSLTPNAAKEAWGMVDKRYRGRLGNIAAEDRVSLLEINDLYNNW